MNHYLVVLAILSSLLSGGSKASQVELKAELKPILGHFTSVNSVGYTVLISQNGKVRFSDALGMANLELGVPLTPQHIFETGSLTKQFTTVAILKLAQQGKLSLDDTINQYINGISTTRGPVTLTHLLSHTSGLVDPINDPQFLATRVQEKITLPALIEQFKNGHWQYAPGERINYSNVGYSMLAYVIQKVTGVSYSEYLTSAIFQPLGMKQTFQASFAVTAGKVSGYTYDGDTPRQNDFLDLGWAFGAGDLISTSQDLARFTHALMQGHVLNQDYLKRHLAPITINGETIPGSFNYSLTDVGQYRAIRTSGSTLGFSSHSIYFPHNDIYIVVLSNSDGINGGAWTPPATVAGMYAAKLLNIPLPDYSLKPISDVHATRLAGNYRLNENTLRKLTFRDGQMFYQRNDGAHFPLVYMGNNRFYFRDTYSWMEIKKVGTSDQQMVLRHFLNEQGETAEKE